MSDKEISEGPLYWIVEWSFKDKNVWQAVDHPPFKSAENAAHYAYRNGFDYRVLKLRQDYLLHKSGKEGLNET